MNQASIAVVIPTLNCASLVPAHLESVAAWSSLAAEIIIVDSKSRDGTVELLRAGLRHPNVRFFEHPPGLYQSWNFGIQQARSEFVYISTVGDAITREGLAHLAEAMANLQADVVISKPRFINEAGNALPDERWPIDDILDRLPLANPTLLTTTQQFIFALTNYWGAILGSSASNLYRAACLQARPFPTGYGTAGDAGWGLQHIFDVRIGVTRGRFSTFRYHEKAYGKDQYYVEALLLKLFRLAVKTAHERQSEPRVAAILKEVDWDRLAPTMERAISENLRLEGYRKGRVPWFLKPAAWQARITRNRFEAAMRSMKEHLPALRRELTPEEQLEKYRRRWTPWFFFPAAWRARAARNRLEPGENPRA